VPNGKYANMLKLRQFHFRRHPKNEPQSSSGEISGSVVVTTVRETTIIYRYCSRMGFTSIYILSLRLVPLADKLRLEFSNESCWNYGGEENELGVL